MVGNKQETLVLGLVDEAPGVDGIVENFLGVESQRHLSVVALAVDGAGQRLKALHHNDLQAIRCIQCHIGEK